MTGQRVSRRAFLAGSLAALTLPAIGACRIGAAPRDRLSVGIGADPAGLDPLLQTGLIEASVYSNVFDPLVTLDEDGQIAPALAESWEARDERTWAFRLRAGVSFHNGEPFDARAVQLTIQRVLDPAAASPIRAQLAAIERVEAPDARTAVIVTRAPFAPLLAELTALMIVPPGHTAQGRLAVEPVGTGPFRLVERVKDDRIVLEANEGYWRGQAALRRLAVRPMPDVSGRLAAARTGQLDLASGVPDDQIATVERSGLKVISRPGVQTLYVRLNARRPPLDDVRVRQAIVHAVDVDQVLATVYGGRARRVNGPYPPEVFAYESDVPPQAYDPGFARFLLRSAGVSEGTPLVFETSRGRYPRDDHVVQAVAGFLSDVGLKTRIQALDWPTYLEKVNAGEGEHLFLLAGTNRTFDPHFTIVRLYASTSAFGRAYYGNPAIDPLAAQAAATLDPDDRRELYYRILGILRGDAPALWIGQLEDLYALQPHVTWTPRADSLLWMYPARAN